MRARVLPLRDRHLGEKTIRCRSVAGFVPHGTALYGGCAGKHEAVRVLTRLRVGVPLGQEPVRVNGRGECLFFEVPAPVG